MSTKLLSFLFRFSIFIQICCGAHAWFVWDIENGLAAQVTLIMCAAIALLYKQATRIKLRTDNAAVSVLFLYSLAYICTFKLSVTFFIGLAMRIIPVWVMISSRESRCLLNWITKAFVYILIPGLVLHVILLFKPLIIGYPIQYHDSVSGSFLNYLVLLKPLYAYSESLQHRFYSVFLEPGYLGTLVAFLLYANNYNFKSRDVKVLLLAEVFSMSLAGYIISFLGYIILKFSQHKSIRSCVFALLTLFFCYYVAIKFNDGDNVINHLIVERLQPDEEKGIAGNNRAGEAVDFYYERVISSEQVFFGMGVDEVARINGNDGIVDKSTKINGAGYKVFIVTHGIVPMLVFFLFYLIAARNFCYINKRYSYGFVFLICITFMQAAYPDSNAWIIPFLLGVMSCQENTVEVIAKN